MFLNISVRSSGLLRHYLLEQSKPLSRSIKLFPPRKPLLLDKSQFRIIYDFPYVHLLAAVMKSKTSVVTAAAVSSAVFFYFEDLRSAAYINIITGACYYCSCCLATKLGDGAVGKVYVNKEGEIKDVIISSLDSNGRRIDRLHKVEDILNIDFPNKIYETLGFSKIAIENSNIQYSLNRFSCKYIDQLAFDFLLGLRPNLFLDNQDANPKKDLPEH